MLDVLVGSRPLAAKDGDEGKDPVKANVIDRLKEELGIEEEDLLSAELEVVPAGKARELGFDRSMILGYGQDDRSCSYTSLIAQLDTEAPKRTAVCLLVDKEEIGSVGATGMRSRWFEDVMAEILELAGEGGSLPLRRCLERSCVLSNDVSVGYDPAFPSVYDPKNAAYLGHGISFIKFTGARGKSGSNDANAEYIAKLRAILDKHNVAFQSAEMGKVDIGGGGTIAYILSLYGMEVIDSGIPVLSMHAPWEAISKSDLYEAYKGYKAFIIEA
jgi:aspartyl aminopeptidase